MNIRAILKSLWLRRPKWLKKSMEVCDRKGCNKDPEYIVRYKGSFGPQSDPLKVTVMSVVCKEHKDSMMNDPEIATLIVEVTPYEIPAA